MKSCHVESWLLKHTNINSESRQGQNLRGLYGNVVMGNEFLTPKQNKKLLERLLKLSLQSLKEVGKKSARNKAFVDLVLNRWEMYQSPNGVKRLFDDLESYDLF